MELNAVRRVLPWNNSFSSRFAVGTTCFDKSNHVLLVRTGIGPDNARSFTRKLLEKEVYDVVISTGFAGALNSWPIGSLVIGHEVLVVRTADVVADLDPPRVVCHPDWVQASLEIQLNSAHSLQCGRFVTLDRVVTHASHKRTLGQQTGAVAVDMESGAIGQVVQEYGLPFLIVRAISDGVHEDLPMDFNIFLKSHGWRTGVRYILSNPRCWKEFFQLYRNSKQAGVQLSKFFEKFFSAISFSAFQCTTTKTGVLYP